jgi:hypothetical protein
MRWTLVATALLLTTACSGSTASSGSGGSSGAPPTTLSIGPIPVAAGEETTVCIVVPYGNTDDVVVNSIDVSLAPGSHHLILYETSAAPTSTPYACTPFAGIALGSDTPLVLAGKEQLTWTFPQGIGQDIPANSNVKIEAHYINATPDMIQGHGQVTFHTTPKSQMGTYQAAGFTFWGTTDINIPPNAKYSTPMQFQAGIADTHLISVTTHQHRLGTGIQAWESTGPGQMGTQVANDLDWANPSLNQLSPVYDFNGTNGLSFQCEWTNTTTQTVTFGESALDEMCFVGGYYYPVQGSGLDLCIDGHCRNRQ